MARHVLLVLCPRVCRKPISSMQSMRGMTSSVHTLPTVAAMIASSTLDWSVHGWSNKGSFTCVWTTKSQGARLCQERGEWKENNGVITVQCSGPICQWCCSTLRGRRQPASAPEQRKVGGGALRDEG